jgi:hypothetical protein
MNIIIDTIKENINKINGINTIYLFYDEYILSSTNNNYTFKYEINKSYETIKKIRDTFMKKNLIIQLGNEEEKNGLVSQIKGVSYNAIQELFSINARELPCVYLTALNTVGILREKMNINNCKAANIQMIALVYKFGLTKSFESKEEWT